MPNMRKILICLIFFAVMASACAQIQTYTYQGENFTGLRTSSDHRWWCYFHKDKDVYDSYCGNFNVSQAAGATDMFANNNTPMKTINVMRGNYRVKISYLDKTAHINPKVQIGSKNYFLGGNYALYTEEAQKDIVTLNGDETISLYVTQTSPSSDSKWLGVDYVKLERVTQIYVDDDWICNNGTENLTPCFNSTLNALKYVNDGDTIYVFNGSYPDTAIMTRNIAVYGESVDGVVLGGLSFYKSDNCSAPDNVRINRLTVKGNGIRFNASAKSAQNISLSNLLIYNNSAPAINVIDGIGSVYIANSTISNNNLGSAYSCEICVNGSSNVSIKSSIVYGTNYSIRGNSGSLNIQKSVVYGVYDVNGMTLFQSNVSNRNPKFVNPRGNFTLFAGSPAIGLAGNGSNAGFWQGVGIEESDPPLPELSMFVGIIALLLFVFFIFVKRKSS